MTNQKTPLDAGNLHLRGLLYFAVPSNIQNRMHLVAFSFDGVEEQAAIYSWAVGRGYLPALEPQSLPGSKFDSRPAAPPRQHPDEKDEEEFTRDGIPVCPVHPGGMLESQKVPGGFYCGRKENGKRCGWEWSPKRGTYNTTGKGAARR